MATRWLFVGLLGCGLPLAAAAGEPQPPSIEKVAACTTPQGVAGAEIVVANVPAAQVRDRVVAAAHIRLVHAERIGPTKVTVRGLGCLPLRAALALLASADEKHMAAVVPDAKGDYHLIAMPHHAEIDRMRAQASELIGKDEAQRRALLEKILPLAVPPTPNDAEEPIGDVYADLTDIANEQKDYARAETLSRARIAQLERLSGTDDAEYGSALAELAYAQLKLGRDDAAAGLERALAVLHKHPGDSSLPDAARAAAVLAQLAATAKQFERAEDLSRQAAEILASPSSERDGWDGLALFRARIADRDAELAIGNAAVEADRDDAAAHFERVLLREKELETPDILQSFAREMVALQSENAQALEDVAAYYATLRPGAADTWTAEEATALWGLALIRAKQQRWDEAIAAWQRLREARLDLCGDGDARARRAGEVDLELLHALAGKPAPDTALRASAAAPDRLDLCSYTRSRLGRTIRRDLAPFLVLHFKRAQRAAADDAARAALQKALSLSDAAVLRQVAPARARTP